MCEVGKRGRTMLDRREHRFRDALEVRGVDTGDYFSKASVEISQYLIGCPRCTFGRTAIIAWFHGLHGEPLHAECTPSVLRSLERLPASGSREAALQVLCSVGRS